MQIIAELEKRGLIQDISDSELDKSLKSGDYFYAGFDPTASSLHLGNFVLIMTMLRLTEAGLKPIMLFGGATGQVGDPGGRSEERPILPLDEITRNVEAQKNQAQSIFERLGYNIEFVDNAEWTTPISITAFFREVGKYITVNYMLAKESVKNRLNGDGISFAEFSYMLIQANDFLHLYNSKGCKMQIGGSDQWGNLTCGLELIRKKIQGNAYAFSIPLLTNSSGKKFGKSVDGALWLDPTLTSPFKLHQFLLNTPDDDVIKMITQLTFADDEKITELSNALTNDPGARTAQKYLADELCTLIHGENATENAKAAAKVLFGGSPVGLPANQLLEIFADVPSAEVSKSSTVGKKYLELLVETGASKSKGEARRLIQNGGAYLNNERVEDLEHLIEDKDFIDEQVMILRTGKKSYHLLKAN